MCQFETSSFSYNVGAPLNFGQQESCAVSKKFLHWQNGKCLHLGSINIDRIGHWESFRWIEKYYRWGVGIQYHSYTLRNRTYSQATGMFNANEFCVLHFQLVLFFLSSLFYPYLKWINQGNALFSNGNTIWSSTVWWPFFWFSFVWT